MAIVLLKKILFNQKDYAAGHAIFNFSQSNSLLIWAKLRNSINYTGQRLDYETGLMPLGNGERYYSSGLGRFIQQDSFTGITNVPASTNRYSYAHNNPVIYTDPFGNIIPFLIFDGFLGGILYSVTKQDAEIRDGTRRQEDFSHLSRGEGDVILQLETYTNLPTMS
jgi:RHS repeat-associated protein